jgi:hypothetical protein
MDKAACGAVHALGSDVLGHIFDRLTFTDIRSAAGCCHSFHQAELRVSRLVIENVSELNVSYLRRFSAVRELRVYCLFEDGDTDDDDERSYLLHADTAQRAVIVMCCLPSLRYAFFGALEYDSGIYAAEATEDDELFFDTECCDDVVDSNGRRALFSNAEGLVAEMQSMLYAAFRCGALSQQLRVSGIIEVASHEVARDREACRRCIEACTSLPAEWVLTRFPCCLSDKKRFRIAQTRGADLNGPNGLPYYVRCGGGLPFQRLDGGVGSDGTFAATILSHTLDILRTLIALGADPSREDTLTDLLREPERDDEFYEPPLGWYNSRGKRQITRQTFDALVELGFPLREEHVDVIDITLEMVPFYNRQSARWDDPQAALAHYCSIRSYSN